MDLLTKRRKTIQQKTIFREFDKVDGYGKDRVSQVTVIDFGWLSKDGHDIHRDRLSSTIVT